MNFLSKKIMPRYLLVTFILIAVAVSVLVRVGYIMMVEYDFWMEKKTELVNDSIVLLPKRGDILACDGRILATSLSEYTLNIDYMSWEKDSTMRAKDQHRRDTVLQNNVDSIAAGMHRLFPDIDPVKYKAHLLRGRKLKSHFWPVYPPNVSSLTFRRRERRNKQLTYLQLSDIKKLPLFKLHSSLNVTPIKMRKNPYGRIAYRTIGAYVDEPRFGLERTYDSILAGKPGYSHSQKVLDSWIRIVDQPVEDGMDIVTTIDIDMQDIVETELHDGLADLKALSGACIVMDVATGDVKAIASMEQDGAGGYAEINPRAVSTYYEPGSVFKPMSFLVAMDDGRVKITDQVDLNAGIYRFGNRNMTDSNRKSGGTVGLRDVKFIIQNSSNVGTSRLIDDAYNKDPQTFIDGLYRVGAGADLEVPVEGYAPPHFCSPHDTKRYWSRTDLPWMSIGYASQMTPINILNFYNGIANNGRLLYPRFVKAIQKEGKTVKEFPVRVLRDQMASQEAVHNIQECLKAVVAQGTGKRAGSKYFQVAGKTGTAQIWTASGRTRNYSVSFVGFFPADKPRFSCIVNIQKPGPFAYGWMSGVVFKRVAEHILAKDNHGNYKSARDTTAAPLPVVLSGNMVAAGRVLDKLKISYHTSVDTTVASVMWGHNRGDELTFVPDEIKEKHVPDVQGYGLRDAVYLLEEIGMEVHSTGVGRVVRQVPKAGRTYTKGDTVYLVLEEETRKHRYHKRVETPVVPETPAEPKPAENTTKSAEAGQPAKETKKESPKQSKGSTKQKSGSASSKSKKK